MHYLMHLYYKFLSIAIAAIPLNDSRGSILLFSLSIMPLSTDCRLAAELANQLPIKRKS